MLVGGQRQAPPLITPGKIIGTHCAAGWVVIDTSCVLFYSTSIKELFKQITTTEDMRFTSFTQTESLLSQAETASQSKLKTTCLAINGITSIVVLILCLPLSLDGL
jgi:hypothetical protein